MPTCNIVAPPRPRLDRRSARWRARTRPWATRTCFVPTKGSREKAPAHIPICVFSPTHLAHLVIYHPPVHMIGRSKYQRCSGTLSWPTCIHGPCNRDRQRRALEITRPLRHPVLQRVFSTRQRPTRPIHAHPEKPDPCHWTIDMNPASSSENCPRPLRIGPSPAHVKWPFVTYHGFLAKPRVVRKQKRLQL